jgi:hypothetical protein
MKKIFLSIAAIAVFAIGCNTKKDYKCTCKGSVDGVQVSSTSTIINDIEDNAKKACSGGSSTSSALGTTVKVECGIE